MVSLRNRIVMITGASSGIGRACACAFAEEGADLILAARRASVLDEIATDLRGKHGVRVLVLPLDVRERSAVEHAIDALQDDWRDIDILVNNAGVPRGLEKLFVGNPDDWEEMIDTNVKGLLYVTRAVVPGMVARTRGHIINIGSIAGHEAYPNGAVYNASKFAVDAITKSLRMDLVDTPLRVSTVDPGMVKTNFSVVRFHGDTARAEKVYENIEALTGDDVAQAVVFCATRPPHVSVNQIVIMPTAQASATIVHRSVG
jgi:3-hydroxy acid dehydrogenase / malonic semialdehyde reductase